LIAEGLKARDQDAFHRGQLSRTQQTLEAQEFGPRIKVRIMLIKFNKFAYRNSLGTSG
jgi:hypothetical protein